jgi:hypothetical protein
MACYSKGQIESSQTILKSEGMSMLVKSVTSTAKDRRRYFYFKNLVSVLVAAFVFVNIGGFIGGGLAIVAALISNFTISPVVAFLICLCEQILS